MKISRTWQFVLMMSNIVLVLVGCYCFLSMIISDEHETAETWQSRREAAGWFVLVWPVVMFNIGILRAARAEAEAKAGWLGRFVGEKVGLALECLAVLVVAILIAARALQ